MKKRILMIGTGGTIASKQTDNGLSPGLSSEDVLSYIPQVKEIIIPRPQRKVKKRELFTFLDEEIE